MSSVKESRKQFRCLTHLSSVESLTFRLLSSTVHCLLPCIGVKQSVSCKSALLVFHIVRVKLICLTIKRFVQMLTLLLLLYMSKHQLFDVRGRNMEQLNEGALTGGKLVKGVCFSSENSRTCRGVYLN